MIKIITAIGNPSLNKELKKNKEFDVIGNDIIYAEGIIELLEVDSKINYLIIGENINNKENIDQFIEKIINTNRLIKIIIIINKKNKILENKLLKNGYVEIFYEDESMENIVNYLKSKNIEYLNDELRAEIDNLKKLILDKNNKYKKNKIKKENIIIGIAGTRGIGKTSFCISIAKSLNKENKILIIDFDLINHLMEEIFNKKIEYSKINELNINNFIFNVDKNIDILVGLNFLYLYNKINFNNFKNIILNLKKEYNYIFVDTYCENNFEKNKYIFNYFDFIFLLSGMNEIELIKSKKIIDFIFKHCKIKKEKIRIIFYKLNFYELLKIIFNKNENKNFYGIKVIGIIKNNFFVNKLINKKNKILKKIKYKKIMEKI